MIFDISIHSNESILFIFKQNLMILFCIASFGSVRFYVYIYEMVFRVCVCVLKMATDRVDDNNYPLDERAARDDTSCENSPFSRKLLNIAREFRGFICIHIFT